MALAEQALLLRHAAVPEAPNYGQIMLDSVISQSK
jgi:hypothetical protein